MTADTHRNTREQDCPVPSPQVVDNSTIAAQLGRIASALECIADVLTSGGDRDAADEATGESLFDLAGVSGRLGVSTRWVQRHLRPSFRASARGKAFYKLADVEAQLAVGEPQPTARTTTRRKPKPITTTSTTVPRREPEADIAAVEARLRATMKAPPRGKR